MTFAKRRVDGKVGQLGEEEGAGRAKNDRGLGENAGERGACGNRDQRPALAEQALDRVAQNERKTGMRQGLSGGQTVPTFITTQLPAGMVRMKRMRLMRPTVRPDMLKGILRVSRGYRSESRRLPKRRN